MKKPAEDQLDRHGSHRVRLSVQCRSREHASAIACALRENSYNTERASARVSAAGCVVAVSVSAKDKQGMKSLLNSVFRGVAVAEAVAEKLQALKSSAEKEKHN